MPFATVHVSKYQDTINKNKKTRTSKAHLKLIPTFGHTLLCLSHPSGSRMGGGLREVRCPTKGRTHWANSGLVKPGAAGSRNLGTEGSWGHSGTTDTSPVSTGAAHVWARPHLSLSQEVGRSAVGLFWVAILCICRSPPLSKALLSDTWLLACVPHCAPNPQVSSLQIPW